jgi:hypothetical protein
MVLLVDTSMPSYLGHHLLLRKFSRRFCRCALSTDSASIETTITSRQRDLILYRVQGCPTTLQQTMLLLRFSHVVYNKHKR